MLALVAKRDQTLLLILVAADDLQLRFEKCQIAIGGCQMRLDAGGLNGRVDYAPGGAAGGAHDFSLGRRRRSLTPEVHREEKLSHETRSSHLTPPWRNTAAPRQMLRL